MIILQQIGDVPIFGSVVGNDGSGLKLNRPYSWNNPLSEITGVEAVVSQLPASTSLAESNTLKLDGMVLATNYQSVDGTIESLKYVSGRQNTKVIGFMLQSVPAGIDEDLRMLSDLQWLENDCVLSDIKVTSEWGTGNSDVGLKISFTLSLGLTWRGLSDLYWEYRSPNLRYDNPYSIDISPLTPQNRFIHPQTFGDIETNNYFFRWPNNLSAMSPAVWGEKYSGNLDGMGSDYASFGITNVFADPLRWQSVSSVYAFTGLSNSTGTLSISITKGIGYFPGESTIEESTLDLSTLDANLASAGHIGLLPTDIIYVGLVDPLPSYVVRDEEIIPGVIAPWAYQGTYPGELGKGYSVVNITGEDVLGVVGYLHEFRVY